MHGSLLALQNVINWHLASPIQQARCKWKRRSANQRGSPLAPQRPMAWQMARGGMLLISLMICGRRRQRCSDDRYGALQVV